MPPRSAQRGAPQSRGAPPSRGAGPAIRAAAAPSGVSPVADHVKTIGVKRPAYGTSGVQRSVLTNHFPISIPRDIITHYDVIAQGEKALPPRLNYVLIKRLQDSNANIFTPKAVYDGRKNLFSVSRLKFPNGGDSFQFDVSLSEARASGKGPKIYKIQLTKVAEINPITLERFLEGKQSHDNNVLTAITALNVVIRMEPNQKYPFNVRSFFTSRERKDLGLGIELWRGYFQSARPSLKRMLINIDISTGLMYKPGPLLDLCLQHVQQREPLSLAPKKGFSERERNRLSRFIQGLRIITTHSKDDGGRPRAPRVIKKLSDKGAADLRFTMRDGTTLTVAEYFSRNLHKALRFPDLPCVEVGSGALLPLELCEVPEGQIMRKQLPSELTKDVLTFATKVPAERLNSIKEGLSVLSYGQSDYVRQFGMHLDPNPGPLKVNARVLPAPSLKYGPGSRAPVITPRDGAWNMIDKRFFKPAEVKGWIIVIYERQQRFGNDKARDLVNGLLDSFNSVGITCSDRNPIVKYENGQGNILQQLRAAGQDHIKRFNAPPNLIVAVLPEGATDMYTSIKHFGDCVTGVATQCLKSLKCSRAKQQYYANVCLKINVKLGGINLIPDPANVRYLTDPANPTLVMGADVAHPPPGAQDSPSYTSLVGNVDSDTSKYIATMRVQTSRQEMIEDLEDMAKHIIEMYRKYRRNMESKKSNIDPRRIIFYRDGVSEGQFQQVVDFEAQKLRDACTQLGINPLPKITVIVVGKRHHVRFFPVHPGEGDRSGNCSAGTVVDRDVTNPVEFDFYLQSHGGLLGTSRPAHYNVLVDENGFSPDGLQQLSFALCHVYARSTRSVSIPAPVYYADIVCARAKNHLDPGKFGSDSATLTQGQSAEKLEAYKEGFKPLHPNAAISMYFS